MLVDNQFKYVQGGVVQVLSGSSRQALVAPLQTMSKNGYLYVYVSNESPQDVYFDDVTVRHYTGALVQEQSYYPFGVQMMAISDKALKKNGTPYKYNAGCELEDELGYYNTFYRKYDAQLGRFTGVDIRSEESHWMSVYNFGANNPVFFNDPLGDKYAYMDANGNKWHGQDPLRGTAGEGTQYRQSWGFTGFGDTWETHDDGGGGGGSSGDTEPDGFQFSGEAALKVFNDLFNAYNRNPDDWSFSVGIKDGMIGYWEGTSTLGEGDTKNPILAQVTFNWRFVNLSGNIPNPDADKAAIAWTKKWKPIADREYVEYSAIIYWYQNKKGDVLYGTTNGVRYKDKLYAKTNSPGPRNKLQNGIPAGAHYFAHIHIHVENTNGNEKFSRGDEEMFVHPNNFGLLNYYLVTPTNRLRFRNVHPWDGFEYWVDPSLK